VQTETGEGCLIKPISDFVRLFGTVINMDESLVVKRRGQYFLFSENLKEYASKDFLYAGTYLGKVKEGRLFPSFNLLGIIAQGNANMVFVDKKTEWLFICGRDIFKKGITKVTGLTRKNDYALVMNSFGECLGYGIIVRNLERERTGVAIENLLDLGDFLRREK